MSRNPTFRSIAPALVCATLAGTALTASASALAESPSDQRGYSTCVGALDDSSLSGVVFPRVYYIAQNPESKTYYVNATAWENGDRVVKRLTCETTRNGRTLLSVETNEGRYALADQSRLEIAER